MRFLIAFLLLFSTATAQQGWLNVRQAPFNSPTGNLLNAQVAIQAAIDSAVKVNGTVYIPGGIYRLDSPLIVHKWDGTNYQPVSIRIVGDDAMWSTTITRLFPSFKDGFGIGIQRGYGVSINKIYLEGDYNQNIDGSDSIYQAPPNYRGDTTCRNTRYSPFAGIVIDPFSYTVPPDGGYPNLTSWYRGTANTNGSKGVKITNSGINKFTVCILTSPNGVTRDASNLLFQNIRMNNGGLIGFAGSQSGEMNNKIQNVGVWGLFRYAFAWGTYGAQEQGHWIVSEYNIAQAVADLTVRDSRKGYPIQIQDGFAESLGRIGTWYGTSDALWSNTLNLLHRNSGFTDGYASPVMGGTKVALFNNHLRYYGAYSDPVIISNDVSEAYNFRAQSIYPNHLIGRFATPKKGKWWYNYGYTLANELEVPINWYDSLGFRYARITTSGTYDVNTQVIILNADSSVAGQAIVTKEVQSQYFIMGEISPFIVNGGTYKLFRYVLATIPTWRPNGTPND